MTHGSPYGLSTGIEISDLNDLEPRNGCYVALFHPIPYREPEVGVKFCINNFSKLVYCKVFL